MMLYEDFTVKEHGFAGHLAAPKIWSDKSVIVVLGGEKDILSGIKIAEKFALNGINAMSVSLYGANGLPKSPDKVPLELFENAVSYLKNVKKSASISVYGVSMGSIFVALTARYVEGIDNIIMVSPTHVPFEGTSANKKTMTGHSVALWRGREIPFVKADFSTVKTERYSFDKRAGRKVTGMWSAFQSAYDDKKSEEKAYLRLEQLHSRILLIAGECDETWNSAYSVKYIKSQLDKASYPYEYKAIIYPHAGHLLGIMPDKASNKLLYCAIPIIGLVYKSIALNKNECLEAMEQSEKQIIAWIKEKRI